MELKEGARIKSFCAFVAFNCSAPRVCLLHLVTLVSRLMSWLLKAANTVFSLLRGVLQLTLWWTLTNAGGWPARDTSRTLDQPDIWSLGWCVKAFKEKKKCTDLIKGYATSSWGALLINVYIFILGEKLNAFDKRGFLGFCTGFLTLSEKGFNKKVWGENWIYKRWKKENKCQRVRKRDVEKGERREKKKNNNRWSHLNS